jgi:lipoprotein-anchoring transpeptidase ErfK/SrfK
LLLAFILSAVFLAWPAPVWADEPTHVVQPGETLFRIALNHGVTVDALRAANGISGNLIYAGQTLTISGVPGLAASTESATTEVNPPAAGEVIHIVQPGETLFKIGLKYNLTWTTIRAANGIVGTKIYAGQRLIIPNKGSGSEVVNDATSSAIEEAPISVPSGEGKRFVVDLSEQRLYAYEGDTLVRTTLVSTGVAQYPTVTGTFYIYLRLPSQRMRGPGYDLPGVPYVQYFYKGYGLHGTYWHNNFGTPMSHGCVNMPTDEAEWAYNWADYGTPVIVQP